MTTSYPALYQLGQTVRVIRFKDSEPIFEEFKIAEREYRHGDFMYTSETGLKAWESWLRAPLNQRAWDLIRHQRMELHTAGLITDEEYAALARDHDAVYRLENYDKLMAQASSEVREALPVELKVPFQRELTVLLVKDYSPEQASADIAAIRKGDSTILKIAPEMYFHQLRLECVKDPTLLEKIAVFYRDENNVLHSIGLRFEDELKWPPGFLQEGWGLEVEISKTRHALAPSRKGNK